MSILLVSLAVLAGLAAMAAGWFASARLHNQRIAALNLQLDAVRRLAAENSSQARRQIGQLQAELASRPPRPQPASAAVAVEGVLASTAPSRPEADGFPRTVLTLPAARLASNGSAEGVPGGPSMSRPGTDGFAETVLTMPTASLRAPASGSPASTATAPLPADGFAQTVLTLAPGRVPTQV